MSLLAAGWCPSTTPAPTATTRWPSCWSDTAPPSTWLTCGSSHPYTKPPPRANTRSASCSSRLAAAALRDCLTNQNAASQTPPACCCCCCCVVTGSSAAPRFCFQTNYKKRQAKPSPSELNDKTTTTNRQGVERFC